MYPWTWLVCKCFFSCFTLLILFHSFYGCWFPLLSFPFHYYLHCNRCVLESSFWWAFVVWCCRVCMSVRWCPSDGGPDKPENTRGLSFTIGCGSIPFTGLSASFTGDLILILSVVLLANNNNSKLTFGVWVPNSCRPHSDTVIIVANNRRTQTERRR